MKLPINWKEFLTLSLLLTMNKFVTSKFNVLLSLIMHTFSYGYLLSIRSLSTPFARLVAGDPLTVGCLVTHFGAPSCLHRHQYLMPKWSTSSSISTLRL